MMRIYEKSQEELLSWLTTNVGPIEDRIGITEFSGPGWHLVSGTYFPSGQKPVIKFYDVRIDDERVAVWFTLVWS